LDLSAIFQSAIAKLTSTKLAEKIGLCTCSLTVVAATGKLICYSSNIT